MQRRDLVSGMMSLALSGRTRGRSYRYGHPKRAGITAREGWKLHDDCKGAEW